MNRWYHVDILVAIPKMVKIIYKYNTQEKHGSMLLSYILQYPEAWCEQHSSQVMQNSNVQDYSYRTNSIGPEGMYNDTFTVPCLSADTQSAASELSVAVT